MSFIAAKGHISDNQRGLYVHRKFLIYVKYWNLQKCVSEGRLETFSVESRWLSELETGLHNLNFNVDSASMQDQCEITPPISVFSHNSVSMAHKLIVLPAFNGNE